MTVVIFLLTSAIIFFFVLRFVNRPIKKLIGRTRSIAKGDYESQMRITQNDELGQLGQAIDKMGYESIIAEVRGAHLARSSKKQGGAN